MIGDVFDGHVPAQLQHVTLEGMGVTAPFIGQVQLGLAGLAAGTAFQALEGQLDPDRLAAQG